MVPQRLQRLAAALAQQGCDYALLSSLTSLRYFTGYRATVEIEPSPITPLLGAFLWIRGEQPAIFLADMEAGEGIDTAVARENISSYTFEEPLHALADLTAKLLARMKALTR